MLSAKPLLQILNNEFIGGIASLVTGGTAVEAGFIQEVTEKDGLVVVAVTATWHKRYQGAPWTPCSGKVRHFPLSPLVPPTLSNGQIRAAANGIVGELQLVPQDDVLHQGLTAAFLRATPAVAARLTG